ncbi:MAG: 50S ribosomal protein L10 [Deltaproteobacteria bacterium]|nr:50S ribosomal protein L10 [Deltaproteobacteria bacterium]
MSVARQQKDTTIAEVRDRFARASSAVLLDFKGVDVETITAFRVEARKAGIDYKVIKNTLVQTALKGGVYDGKKAVADVLTGQTGVAWSYDDPSIAAKVVRDFRKLGEKQGKLTVKCGLIDGAVIPGEKVESDMASMPGKNECRATLLATLQAPAQTFLRVLQAAPQNFLYLLNARERQQG